MLSNEQEIPDLSKINKYLPILSTSSQRKTKYKSGFKMWYISSFTTEQLLSCKGKFNREGNWQLFDMSTGNERLKKEFHCTF